jgi:hypothetical protein
MTAGGHSTRIEAGEPSDVAVGAELVVKVTLSCPAGCDLSGVPLAVVAPDGAAATIGSADGAGEDVRTVALTAPLRVGEHVWRISCAPHEVGGIRHARRFDRDPAVSEPHRVGDPSPVGQAGVFIKAGAKSGDCDERPFIGFATSGTAMASGSSAVRRGRLCLLDRARTAGAGRVAVGGVRCLGARNPPKRGGVSHRDREPPEHKLTVRFATGLHPNRECQVRLGAYRGRFRYRVADRVPQGHLGSGGDWSASVTIGPMSPSG